MTRTFVTQWIRRQISCSMLVLLIAPIGCITGNKGNPQTKPVSGPPATSLPAVVPANAGVQFAWFCENGPYKDSNASSRKIAFCLRMPASLNIDRQIGESGWEGALSLDPESSNDDGSVDEASITWKRLDKKPDESQILASIENRTANIEIISSDHPISDDGIVIRFIEDDLLSTHAVVFDDHFIISCSATSTSKNINAPLLQTCASLRTTVPAQNAGSIEGEDSAILVPPPDDAVHPKSRRLILQYSDGWKLQRKHGPPQRTGTY